MFDDFFFGYRAFHRSYFGIMSTGLLNLMDKNLIKKYCTKPDCEKISNHFDSFSHFGLLCSFFLLF